MPNKQRWVWVRQAIFVLVALLSIVFWFFQDRGSELKGYCNNIALGDQYDSVLASAKSRGFSVPFYAQEKDRITIFNKSGMLFEYGCTVHFINQGVVDSTFFKR